MADTEDSLDMVLQSINESIAAAAESLLEVDEKQSDGLTATQLAIVTCAFSKLARCSPNTRGNCRRQIGTDANGKTMLEVAQKYYLLIPLKEVQANIY